MNSMILLQKLTNAGNWVHMNDGEQSLSFSLVFYFFFLFGRLSWKINIIVFILHLKDSNLKFIKKRKVNWKAQNRNHIVLACDLANIFDRPKFEITILNLTKFYLILSIFAKLIY